MTGNQAIVVWAIKRPEEKPVLNPQSGSFDFDDSFSSIADESKALHDDISDALNATNVQYAKIFSRVLRGYEGAEDLKKHNDPMVVVILDAATTGRLGVTFYCELQKDEYIKRILQWHVDAAWPLTSFKKSIVEGAERVNVVQYEGAPSFTDIINCACDTSDRSSKSYKRFAKDVKERLIRNRWIAYLQRSQHRLGKDVFGEDLYTPTTNFPKKVVSSDANAKLLSANDSTNFTFRGRFSSKEQALLVDSASSQKINSTLRWLVNIFGICVAFPTTALSHTPWSLRESTHPSYISRRGISASRTTPYLSL